MEGHKNNVTKEIRHNPKRRLELMPRTGTEDRSRIVKARQGESQNSGLEIGEGSQGETIKPLRFA